MTELIQKITNNITKVTGTRDKGDARRKGNDNFRRHGFGYESPSKASMMKYCVFAGRRSAG